MPFIVASIIVLFSSCYVLFLSYIAHSTIELLKAIILPSIILLILIIPIRAHHDAWQKFKIKWEKYFFLLWGTIFIQMLVLATGGLQSPFLILLYLFMVTIGFFLSFALSVVFLVASLFVIFINLSGSQSITAYLFEDPRFTILHVVSLITILPLAYLISRQYHLRDMLFGTLHTKVQTDEAIMRHLQELIFITDSDFTILSVNNAVEQTLQKSRQELLGHQLFSLLVLRDANGKLATKTTFFLQGDTTTQPLNLQERYDLLLTALPQKKVTVHVQSTKGIGNSAKQISFILSPALGFVSPQNSMVDSLEKTRAKYEALNENVRKELLKTNLPDLITQTSLLREIENDMYFVQFFNQNSTIGMVSSIDTAKLVKQIVQVEQEFAKAFDVKLDFLINDFGEKDIAHLTVKNYPVAPDQLTGPFFTVKTDVRRCELLVKKLLDLAILLSSGKTDAHVSVSIQREKQEKVMVTISAKSVEVTKALIPDLFIPYYGRLGETAQVHAGSGFEGYLAKTICNDLSYKLDTKLTQHKLLFTLIIDMRLVV